MPNPIKHTCDRCGKTVILDKDEGGLQVIEEMGTPLNLCEECVMAHYDKEREYREADERDAEDTQ